MKLATKEEIKNYLENLEGFDGYVQISNREFDKDKDIFINKKIQINDKEGFIVEAAFSNGKKSIMVNFINGEWIVNEYELNNKHIEFMEFNTRIKDFNKKIKMAQIFEETEEEISDINGENRESIKTLIFKTSVFAGFKEIK